MKKGDAVPMPRRQFITSASFLMLGGGLLGMPAYSSGSIQAHQELREELTSDELKIVKSSVMAKDLDNYFEDDYSCAESMFMVSLKYLKKSENLVWIASGFGGGLYHEDLCGFLTGGIMAIGLSSGSLKEERWSAKEACALKVEEYWKWWTSIAPLHCSEILTEGRTSKICFRLGHLASAKVEKLIKPE